MPITKRLSTNNAVIRLVKQAFLGVCVLSSYDVLATASGRFITQPLLIFKCFFNFSLDETHFKHF